MWSPHAASTHPFRPRARRHRPVFAGRARRQHRVPVRPDPAGSGDRRSWSKATSRCRRGARSTTCKAVCEAAGGSFDDIVRLGLYLTDLGDFAKVNAVMAEYFTEPYPGAFDDRGRRAAARRARSRSTRSWCSADRCRASCHVPRRRQAAPSVTAGETPLATLPGVGPRVAEKLAARGLLTLQDLWLQLPRQYEDRTRISADPRRCGRASPRRSKAWSRRSSAASATGRCCAWRSATTRSATLVLRFFHFRAAQVAQFAPGTRVRCYGTPRAGQHGLEIVHPSYRVLDARRGARSANSSIRCIRRSRASARVACAA